MTRPQPSDRPQPKPGIMDIEAYVPGKSGAPGGAIRIHKLSANENPLGPSPAAVQAARDAAATLALYPDGSSRELRYAIAKVHGLDVARVLAFNGSDEALALIARVYLGPGDEGLYSEHGFLAYRIYIQGTGASPVMAREYAETTDVDAMLAAVTPRTKVVFLANPNNPTGTFLNANEIRRLHAGLPATTLLVLDAAYAEFVRRDDYDAGSGLVDAAQNVVMTRTFSKVYGLGGARIGWLYGPAHVVEALERVRDPFNVNAVAIAAGIAAMQDRDHVERSVTHVDTWRDWLTAELSALGLRVTPSAGNFLLIHFPGNAGRNAAEADAFLASRGYILRGVGAYGLPNALRMTIGTEDANRGVISALREFLGG